MIQFYTKTVPLELAEALYEIGMTNATQDEYYYALTDLDITYDDYCIGKIDKGGIFYMTPGEIYHGKYIPAYTYADAIDWLMSKGIFIQMEPWHTFALQERMGFVYHINTINQEQAKIECETWNDFASFGLCLNAAIERAIEILKESRK